VLSYRYDGQLFSYCLHSFNSVFSANSMLCTVLFCSSVANLDNVILCTDFVSALQCVSVYCPYDSVVAEFLIEVSCLRKSRKYCVLLGTRTAWLAWQGGLRYGSRSGSFAVTVVSYRHRCKTSGIMFRETNCM
jgi:hypothetical protein